MTNVGVNPASGTWTDTAYLSADAIWDIGDRPIGRFTFTRHGCSRASSYTGTLDANLPPADARPVPRHRPHRHLRRQSSSRDELNNTTASADVLKRDRARAAPGRAAGDDARAPARTGCSRSRSPHGQTLRVDLTAAECRRGERAVPALQRAADRLDLRRRLQGALQANQFAVIPSTDGRHLLRPGPRPVGAGAPTRR